MTRRRLCAFGSAPAGRAGVVASAGLLAVALAACGGGAGGGAAGDRPAAAPGPTAAERRALHDGLERVGRACSPQGGRPGAQRIVAREVSRLVDLNRRYPRQRFALERGGETGTMLSVLLVARAELIGCSPAGVEAIDRLLPRRVRSALPPPRGARVP